MASQESFDSDATVAPDESEGTESDVLMETECSPSILHANSTHKEWAHFCNNDNVITNVFFYCRDIVSCSSDSNAEEILSQEYPPPKGSL